MDDIGTVHKQKPSQNLIHEVLDVLIAEILSGVDNSMQICFHQLRYNVDVSVAGLGLWLQQIDHVNDILMLEKF